ncbi:hypothetical protein, partial [Enterobacter genomosp. O]|uniref:hypothetical protein n=1 Tax=Enterobacter genomosp. O TaxID=2364150 RepID=UPI000AE93990
FGSRVLASGVVNHLAQGLDFAVLQALKHVLLQGLPVVGPARRRAFQQRFDLADRDAFFNPVEDF